MNPNFIEKHLTTLMSEIFACGKFRGFAFFPAKSRNLIPGKYIEGSQLRKLFLQKWKF